MGTVYISIIMLCRVAQHLCNKHSSNAVKGKVCFFKYSSYRQLLSATLGLLLIIFTGSGIHLDIKTVIISAVSGIMLVASMGCSLMFLKTGTVALTSLFSTAGVLVPCVAGIYLFNEPMSSGQWFGFGIFLIASYFLMTASSKIYCKFTPKNFLLLLGVMLANGCTMLAQQMFTFYVPNGDVSVFSFLSFGIVGIAMLVVSVFVSRKENKSDDSRLTPRLLGLGAVLSVAVFIVNQLATLSTAIVPPAILFTAINGGSTIIGAIVAAIFFKEKLTPRSIIGILLGVSALIIIKVM